MSVQNSEDIRQIELTIESAHEAVAKAEALERLQDNPDFKLVIKEGYFVKESCRLIRARGLRSANFETQENMRVLIERDMEGISTLGAYFGLIFQEGNAAAEALESDQDTLAELNAEGLEE